MSLEDELKNLSRQIEGNTRALGIVAERLGYLGKLLGTAALNVKPIELETALIETSTGMVEIDVSGVPWDERIHSAGRSKTEDGAWRRRKGADEEEYEKVCKELRAAMRREVAAMKKADKQAEKSAAQQEASIEHRTQEHDAAPDDTPWVEPEPSAIADRVITAPEGLKNDKVEPPEWTIDDLRARAAAAGKALGRQFVIDLLSRFGAKSLPELKETDYHAFVTALEATK